MEEEAAETAKTETWSMKKNFAADNQVEDDGSRNCPQKMGFPGHEWKEGPTHLSSKKGLEKPYAKSETIRQGSQRGGKRPTKKDKWHSENRAEDNTRRFFFIFHCPHHRPALIWALAVVNFALACFFSGFFLGTAELTLWVMFYTFRVGFREKAGYSAESEQDLIAASVIVTVDLVVNVLLICGANKDYSGRRKDLRWVGAFLWHLHRAFPGFTSPFSRARENSI